MEKAQGKIYRVIALICSLLILVSNLVVGTKETDDGTSNIQQQELVKLEEITFNKSIPIINVKSVSSIIKRENILQDNSSIDENEFNYRSPIQKDYLEINPSLIEFVGSDNYDRYVSFQETEYNCNIYSFIKYFNINKEFFINLELYSLEEVEILYSEDSNKIADLVIIEGAYYCDENNTIYTVEWLKTATIDDIVNENIDLNELVLNIDKTTAIIDGVLDNNTSANYRLKILTTS